VAEFKIDIVVDAKRAQAGAATANAALQSVKREAGQVEQKSVSMGKELENAMKATRAAAMVTALAQIPGTVALISNAVRAMGAAFEWAFEPMRKISEEASIAHAAWQRTIATMERAAEIRDREAGAPTFTAEDVKIEFASPEERERLLEARRVDQQMAMAKQLGDALKEIDDERVKEIDARKQRAEAAQAAIDAAVRAAEAERKSFASFEKATGFGLPEKGPSLTEQFEAEQADRKSRIDAEIKAEQEIAEERYRMAEQTAQTRLRLEEDAARERLAVEQRFADEIASINMSLYANLGDAIGDFIRGTEQDFSRTVQRMLAELAKFLAMRAAMQAGASAGGAQIAGNLAASLFGFADGGDFKVGGAGGTDSRVVAFRATPGETVSVRRPDQAPAGAAGATNVRVINQVDPSDMVGVLESGAGERAVINVIRRNAALMKRLAR
jgi:hypothetical protein